MSEDKISTAENWDGSKIRLKKTDLIEWMRWDLYNMKRRIHPRQKEFTEKDYIPKDKAPF